MQNQKVKSLVDLQKALTDFITRFNEYLKLTEEVLKGQPKEVREFVESMLESLAFYNLPLNHIKDLFSCFQAEQTAKEQSLRKLLDDGIKEFLNSHRCISSELQIPPWKRDQIREGILKVFDEGSLRKGETDQK